jgi:hypothetical protein
MLADRLVAPRVRAVRAAVSTLETATEEVTAKALAPK